VAYKVKLLLIRFHHNLMWSSDFRYKLAHNHSEQDMTRLLPSTLYMCQEINLHLLFCQLYRVGPKKWTPNAVHITSSNIGRFSQFFCWYNLQKICNSAVINYSTTPQTLHYTTLWNIYVRKLARPVWCGSLREDEGSRIPTCGWQQLQF